MRICTTPWLLLAGLTLGGAAFAGEPQAAAGVDSNVSGMKVAIDPATGAIRPMTTVESNKLSATTLAEARAEAKALNKPLNESEARKTMRRRSDGMVSVKAPVSSMTEMRATIGADGKVTTYEAQPGSPVQPVHSQEAIQ